MNKYQSYPHGKIQNKFLKIKNKKKQHSSNDKTNQFKNGHYRIIYSNILLIFV